MSALPAPAARLADDKFVRVAQAYGVDVDVLKRLQAQEQSDDARKGSLTHQARVLGFAERIDVLPFQRPAGDAAR